MGHFFHSGFFKYLKNLIIGVGAAVVLIGALFKIQSWEGANEMLTYGLLTEAGLFLMLGLLGPEKDYYWEKLYPGLDKYSAKLQPATVSTGTTGGVAPTGGSALNGAKVEQQLGGMLQHLETMAGSMSALKALQEIDFSGTSDQIKKMGSFYSHLNEAMANINDSIEDTRLYKNNLSALNTNLTTANQQMQAVNTVYKSLNESAANLVSSVEDTREYKTQLQSLNKNLKSLNNVYGNILTAMGGGK